MNDSTLIDEKTKISLFAVLVSLSSVVVIVLWLAGLSAKTDQALANSLDNETKLEKQIDLLTEIKDRVIRIEEKLNQGGRRERN